MGTSGPYKPSPNWSAAKTELTNALNAGTPQGEEAKNIVGGFAQQLARNPDDGFGALPSGFGQATLQNSTAALNALLRNLPPRPATFSGSGGRSYTPGRGGGGGGGGGAGTHSRAGRSGSARGGSRASAARSAGGALVRPAAQRLADFISQVPKVGLRQALTNAGLADVANLRPDEIALAVGDVLVRDASQLIMTELRDAMGTVVEELCKIPQSFEEAEQRIVESAGSLESIVQRLFECYIMERFKTFFCEHEAAKHGYDAADRVLREAREFISTEMDIQRADKHDLTAVDWTGPEGAQIVDAILERTIAVYAG